eukprot:scaffold375_cov157-Amphora_coffeaeformis.AAC.8
MDPTQDCPDGFSTLSPHAALSFRAQITGDRLMIVCAVLEETDDRHTQKYWVSTGHPIVVDSSSLCSSGERKTLVTKIHLLRSPHDAKKRFLVPQDYYYSSLATALACGIQNNACMVPYRSRNSKAKELCVCLALQGAVPTDRDNNSITLCLTKLTGKTVFLMCWKRRLSTGQTTKV